MAHKMKRTFLLLALAMVFSSGAWSADKAPDFSLKDTDGEKFTLSEAVKSGPVLIDFWATWCKPCKKALPHIQHLKDTYGEQGLQVITISVDNPRSQAKIKPFLQSQKYDFTVLLDSDYEVRQLFGGKDIPFTALIDTDGSIILTRLGFKPGDEVSLDEQIKALLDTKKTTTPEVNE